MTHFTAALVFCAAYMLFMASLLFLHWWPSRPGLPDPEVGQIWRCAFNGERMRVSDVHVHTSGSVFVTCTDWIPERHWCGQGPSWGLGEHYSIGLAQWRRHLRSERRDLVGKED